MRRPWPAWWLLGLVMIVGPGRAPAQVVPISVDPVMVRGPATAPVTIVEFADYQ
jgi:hypothetical protein